MKNKTFPILLAFLCMGFGDAVGPFVGLAQKHFELSDFMAGLTAFMGFIMFGLLSIPIGLLQDRTGKKFILLLGLFIALVGMIIPLFGLTQYALFLITILLLGTGASILQVAGNPIMRDVSPPEKYSRNLTIGQLIKAIGTLSGSLIPFIAAKFFDWDFRALFPIYSFFILLTVIWIALTPIEEHKDPKAKPATLLSCLALLANPYILMMVLGIFIYVGVEVCFFSKVPTYLEKQFQIDLEKEAILGSAFFAVCILAGRFLGSVVLNFMSPQKFLILTVFIALLGAVGLIFVDQLFLMPTFANVNPKIGAYLCIMLAGVGCANVFPLIFSITVNNMPERSNEISGLMVTAIVGGAFIPLLMGYVIDKIATTTDAKTAIARGFVVPVVGLVYLLVISFISPKQKALAS